MNRSYSKIRHIQEANILLEKRILESKYNNLKPLLSEQEVKQGAAGDPYQYKKEGGKYFYAKKAEGTNAKWVERTDDTGIKAIQTKIFKEQPGTTNQPTNTNQPAANKPVVNQPTNTNQPATNKPAVNQPTNTNTPKSTPTKSGSLIGKTYTFEGKTCTIQKEIKVSEKLYLILPNGGTGCRKNNGIVDNEKGYVYLSLSEVGGTSGSLSSDFNYNTKTKSFSSEILRGLATINLT